MYFVILCLGTLSNDYYKFRKQLIFKNIILKFLNKKLKYFLNINLNKNLLKGNIALISINKVNYTNDFLIIDKLLKDNKNYVYIGIIYNYNFYSLYYFKNNILNYNYNYNLIKYNNIQVIKNINFINIKILQLINYVNNKSNNKRL
jgi:hypothetical protein